MVRYIADNEAEPSTIYETAPAAYLVLVANGQASQTFPLRGEVDLGRDKSNGIVVADQKISRHHASLTPVDDHYILTDQGSANGSYLNGVLISQPVRLKNKDHLNLGDTHFVFTTSTPDPNANYLESVASTSSGRQPPAAYGRSSFGKFTAESSIYLWTLVGCLGLIIIGLLVILALMLGLFVGRSPTSAGFLVLALQSLL